MYLRTSAHTGERKPVRYNARFARSQELTRRQFRQRKTRKLYRK